MVIKSDITLRGTSWNKVIEALKTVFTAHPHYDIFMLALSIGIMYDKRLSTDREDVDTIKSVPRNVINNNDNGRLDYFFQAAILTTRTEGYSEDTRLNLAFGDDTEFNKLNFLIQFANFGVTKLEELLADSTIETMNRLKNFCAASVEGRNFDIDALSEDAILDSIGEMDL